MADPVEDIVAQLLTQLCIPFERHKKVGHSKLDFYLTDLDVYIECSRFYTPRKITQLGQADNVILVQGLAAAGALVMILGRSP